MFVTMSMLSTIDLTLVELLIFFDLNKMSFLPGPFIDRAIICSRSSEGLHIKIDEWLPQEEKKAWALYVYICIVQKIWPQ